MRTRFSLRTGSLAAACVVLVAGCGETEAPGPPLAGDPDAPDTVPAETATVGPAVGWSARPPVRVAPELGEDGTTLILFEATEAFPKRFSAYFPEHLGVELIRSGEGVAARFAGSPDEAGGRVVLVAFFPTEEIATDDIRGWMREVAEDRGANGVERVDPPQREWARLEYRFVAADSDPPVEGRVSLGRQDDQYFYVLVQGPRGETEAWSEWVDPILLTWEWEDGEPLTGGDER